MLDVLLTRTELARVRGVDPRNKSLADFHPVALLQTGSRTIPLFHSPLPVPQPKPLQPEAKP
jgi:hypothetical protein